MSALSDDLAALLEDAAGERDAIRLADLVATIGRRAHAILLVLAALLNILPTTVIPGLTAAAGLIVTLAGLQMLIGSEGLWLPRRLRDFSLDREKLSAAVRKAIPWLRRIERVLRPRLTFLVEPPLHRLNALLFVLMGALMIALSWFPFGSFVPSVAVMVLALGVFWKDGVALSLGYLAALASCGVVGVVFAYGSAVLPD
jgi:hypothetical protein